MSAPNPESLRGFTLVEMIVAIVIIGVGLAGVLSAFNTTVRASADPLVRKQLIAIAEGMMEEIMLKPWADPGTGGSIGAGCDRRNADDIQDYAGYTNRAICSVDGVADPVLTSYRVSVAVAADASLTGIIAADTRMITVTATNGAAESFSLIGWRTNYATP